MALRGVGLAVLLAPLALVGCNQGPGRAEKAPSTKAADHAADSDHGHQHAHAAVHGGWWCEEHGVPEAECGQCDAKLAAEFQKKGDWCQDHQRPDSQCFVCHPELKDQFAARYEAKFGQKPPAPH
jgi:cobalt-zinc-cadmium efflux system membrane fusion protein